MKFNLSAPLLRQYAIAALVNFGSLTTGISMYWPSPMILKLTNGTDTPLSRPITDEEGSWIVSGGYLLALFTNIINGMLMDKIGRKYCIILVTIPRICASVWTIFVTEVWMLVICRAVMVSTDCLIFFTVPVYVSEIASKEHRGALGTFLHISSCVGIVITLAIGPFLSYVALNTILATVIILTALPLPFIPDSPFYLHSKGKINDSIAILSKIRSSDEIIKEELEEYKSSKVVKIDKIALLKDKIFYKSLALGILVCGGANAIGYNAVSFYLQTILESTNTSVQSDLASVIIGIIQLIAALCTTFFTRLFGRRPILIYTMIGMFFGMLGLGVYFKIKTIPGYTIAGFLNYLPLICLILNTYCFNVVNFVSFTTGVSFAWPSPMIVKLYNGTDTPLSRPITEEEGSWIVSTGYLVAVITNLLGGILIDKIGRKYCIVLVTIPRIFVAIWTIFVTEVWMLILCRIVMVISDCFIFVGVSVYVSEIASKEHRGSLGTFLHIMSCLGIVITFIVGPFLSYRAFNTFLAIAIVVTSLPLPFIPHSPVGLHSKGHIDEAVKVLSELRDSEKIVKEELEDYQLSQQNKVDKISLLKNKTFLKSLALGSLICAGTSGIGYNAVSFYMQTILESSHTTVKPEIASVVIGGIQFFAAICSCFFTKMFGRRPIMIYSILGMLIGMVCLGTFFKISSIEGYTVSGFLNYLPVLSLMLCTYCFNVGIGSLVFVVTVELFDGPARALGCSICWGWTFLFAFITSKYFAEATTALGPSVTYWFFSVICLLVGSLIMFFVPETKGKTFGEIQISLGNHKTRNEANEKQLNV